MAEPTACPCGTPDLPIPTTGTNTKCLACGRVSNGPAPDPTWERGED